MIQLMGLFVITLLEISTAQNSTCYPNKTCAINEDYGYVCGYQCLPTCQSAPCHERSPCGYVCYCKDGYIREYAGGPCIPTDDCTKVVQCPPNEEYKECGSACEPTCQNKDPQICTLQCVRGCFCKKGGIREGPGGRCVPESCQNVKICKGNEVYSSCVSCPRYCNESENAICPLYCRSGCDCKKGFVWNSRSNPTCVPEASCCGENQVFNDCGTACPGTCSQPVKRCNKKCARGCFCKKDYILDDNTKKCIKKSDCPK